MRVPCQWEQRGDPGGGAGCPQGNCRGGTLRLGQLEMQEEEEGAPDCLLAPFGGIRRYEIPTGQWTP